MISKGILSTLALVALLLLNLQAGWAQSRHQTAQNMAMGGGGTAYMDDYTANFVNPANLMLADGETSWSLGVLGGISSSLGGSLANISAYNKHFTNGNLLDEAGTRAALDQFFGNSSNSNRTLGGDVDIVLGGISYRNPGWALSLSVRFRGLYTSQMSKGFAAFALQGPSQAFFSEARAVDFSSELLTYTEISMGGAMELWKSADGQSRLYGGVAPKILIGSQGSRYELNSTLQVMDRQITHQFDYRAETVGSMTADFREYLAAQTQRSSDGTVDPSDYFDGPEGSDFTGSRGSGFGIDLGLTYERKVSDWFPNKPGATLRVAASLTDLGSIRFDKETGTFTNSREFVWEGFEYDKERIDEQFGSLGDYTDHVVSDSIGRGIYLDYDSEESEDIVRALPAMLNLGGSLEFGKFTTSMDVGVGLVERGLNSPRMSLSLGGEYRIGHIVPVRAGIRFGGISSTALSFGTGLQLRNFEFAVGMMTVPSSGSYGSVNSGAWSGLVFHF